jgi:protein involved in polysaccharide export with SLBB domain
MGRRSPTLVRFGDDVFHNGTGNFDQLPMDLPVGPDYVLGPGDSVSINLWGGVSQRLRRVVDGEGRIALPEAGFVQVSGRSLGDVQRLVQTSLQSQFRDVQADVSLARLRTIRIYVVGDVERAGAYDISSLSTPLNAVFMAGGPTSRGSLRTLRHYRGNMLVQEVDVYDTQTIRSSSRRRLHHLSGLDDAARSQSSKGTLAQVPAPMRHSSRSVFCRKCVLHCGRRFEAVAILHDCISTPLLSRSNWTTLQ